jgi:hypothetical protein
MSLLQDIANGIISPILIIFGSSSLKVVMKRQIKKVTNLIMNINQ